MSEGFAISQSLEILILKKCNLKDAGVKFICKSIAINENLKVCDFYFFLFFLFRFCTIGSDIMGN